ncbi:hypothetical protein GCM10027051_22940 [Niabella terrae]
MRNMMIAGLFTGLLFSCTKDKDIDFDNTQKGTLTVEFDNIVGDADLQLNTARYINSSSEEFSVTKLKYYVSNFEFTRNDGSVYIVPPDSSYFLIDESVASSHRPQFRLPEGKYSSLSFIVGVDSLRSTSDISERTGVLDPAGEGGDMYWGWNSGYIFLKLEGGYGAGLQQQYMYHIGGFGGYNAPTINNIKTIRLNLTARGMPQVTEGNRANIHLMVDLKELFQGPAALKIAEHPNVMFSDYSTVIADNYAAMFHHDHTEN